MFEKFVDYVEDYCLYLRYRRMYERFKKRYYNLQTQDGWTTSYRAYELRNAIEFARHESNRWLDDANKRLA